MRKTLSLLTLASLVLMSALATAGQSAPRTAENCTPKGYVANTSPNIVSPDPARQFCLASRVNPTNVNIKECLQWGDADDYVKSASHRNDVVSAGVGAKSTSGRALVLFYCQPKRGH